MMQLCVDIAMQWFDDEVNLLCVVDELNLRGNNMYARISLYLMFCNCIILFRVSYRCLWTERANDLQYCPVRLVYIMCSRRG